VPSPSFNLYLVSDRTQTGGRDLLWVLERALEGGVNAVQLREKDLSGRDLLELATKTRTLCERYGAPLFINDRIDVALAVDAAGVQLGKASLPIEVARTLLGPDKLIGASIHSPEEVRDAKSAGADFFVFGPVYFTPSKASFGAPQGVSARLCYRRNQYQEHGRSARGWRERHRVDFRHHRCRESERRCCSNGEIIEELTAC
jgi:thiamine-phosphate pyrophosphorylase